MDGLTEGRMVHYVMPNGEHRPAIISKAWSQTNGCSNLIVFPDGSNDAGYTEADREALKNKGIDSQDVKHGHFRVTSRVYSEDPMPDTWHWIEKA